MQDLVIVLLVGIVWVHCCFLEGKVTRNQFALTDHFYLVIKHFNPDGRK